MTKRKIPTWTCADGRILKITDMEIGHLINTFHFLKRRARDEYALYMERNTEDADEYEEEDISVDKFCGSVWPIYVHMRKEIANRLRAMKEGSVERKYWHMKFSKDSKVHVVKSDLGRRMSQADNMDMW